MRLRRQQCEHIRLVPGLMVRCSIAGAFLLGCAGEPQNKATKAGGTIVISASADPDILFPPLTITAQGKQIVDQVFDNLADIGDGLNTVGDAEFRPRLARTWRWAPDSTWIEFSVDPRARWHDGKRVTANDIRFTYSLVKSSKLGSPLSPNLDEVDSVTIPDTLVARVWLDAHPPNVFFKIAGTVAILPAHLLSRMADSALQTSSFARHPVGSGRFRFESWKQGETVTLVADSANYRGRPHSDRVVWVISPDYNAAALRFVSGKADFLDVVKSEFVARAAGAGRHLDTSVPSLNYGYVAFNLRDPETHRPHAVFSRREVRRALVMAVDREGMVKSVFDTLGVVAHGPVTRALPTGEATDELPFDTVRAGRVLDSVGWRRRQDGIRARNGRPLRFSLLVPASSAIRMKFAVLLQEQWRRIGAEVKIEQAELSTFGAQLERHDFDAMINAWQIDPDPASVRDEWMSPGRREGGMNFVSYGNPAFDAIVDSAAHEASPGRAKEMYRRAYRLLTADAPAMWLYEPRNVFGISARLVTAGMRPDAWWASLPDWYVRN